MPVLIVYILVYLVLAFYAGRWNRGVLPVAAALAVLLAIFALVAAPGWFNREKPGYIPPHISADLLGILTLHRSARPAAPDRLRDARLLAGMERRARALLAGLEPEGPRQLLGHQA